MNFTLMQREGAKRERGEQKVLKNSFTNTWYLRLKYISIGYVNDVICLHYKWHFKTIWHHLYKIEVVGKKKKGCGGGKGKKWMTAFHCILN